MKRHIYRPNATGGLHPMKYPLCGQANAGAGVALDPGDRVPAIDAVSMCRRCVKKQEANTLRKMIEGADAVDP